MSYIKSFDNVSSILKDDLKVEIKRNSKLSIASAYFSIYAFEKLKNEVVDVEEMGSGISIMDLGLNEFRLDLLEYIKENPDAEKNPTGMNAVVKATPDMPAGVIYILKNVNKDTNINNRKRT